MENKTVGLLLLYKAVGLLPSGEETTGMAMHDPKAAISILKEQSPRASFLRLEEFRHSYSYSRKQLIAMGCEVPE